MSDSSLTPPVTPAMIEAAAEQDFTAYFVRNYPGPDTIIHDPKWHAPRIFHAARRALELAALSAAPRTTLTDATEDELLAEFDRRTPDDVEVPPSLHERMKAAARRAAGLAPARNPYIVRRLIRAAAAAGEWDELDLLLDELQSEPAASRPRMEGTPVAFAVFDKRGMVMVDEASGAAYVTIVDPTDREASSKEARETAEGAVAPLGKLYGERGAPFTAEPLYRAALSHAEAPRLQGTEAALDALDALAAIKAAAKNAHDPTEVEGWASEIAACILAHAEAGAGRPTLSEDAWTDELWQATTDENVDRDSVKYLRLRTVLRACRNNDRRQSVESRSPVAPGPTPITLPDGVQLDVWCELCGERCVATLTNGDLVCREKHILVSFPSVAPVPPEPTPAQEPK